MSISENSFWLTAKMRERIINKQRKKYSETVYYTK
nr:MAG TPA: hypothetical protein [Caudoviricetes sp.]